MSGRPLALVALAVASLFLAAPRAGAAEGRLSAGRQGMSKAADGRPRRPPPRRAQRRRVPSAVLFDLDGTLTDSEPLIARIQQQVFHEFGYPITLERIEALVGTPFNSGGARPGRLQLLGIPEKDHEAIETRYRTELAGRQHETPRIAYADRLLRRLAARRIPMAIVTNKNVQAAEGLVAQMGWGGYFKAIVGHGTPGAGVKPDGTPAVLALKLLGDVPAGEAAMVGDSPSDMTSGLNAAIPLRVGLLTSLRSARELREAGATHVSPTLRQVERVLLGR